MNDYNTNTVKALLSFFWLVPLAYKFLDLYIEMSFKLPNYLFNILLIISFISTILLLVIWFREFSQLSYLRKSFQYLQQNDIDSLDKIYNKIPKILFYNNRKTLIKYAVDNQLSAKVVSYLLSKADYIEFTNNQEYNTSVTLFHLSAYYNHFNTDMFNFLINSGANINFIDNSRGFEGLSILHCLILRGNANTISLALKHGADLEYFITDQSMNALMLACRYIEDPVIIKILLDYGAIVDETNKDGYNALLIASRYNNNPAVIQILINYKAEIKPYKIKEAILKQNTVTPLYLAAAYNVGEVVKILIQLGDDPNFKDIFGMSILFVACAHNNDLEAIKLLINNGVLIEDSRDDEGNTPLMVASYLNSNLNIIRYLMNKSHNLGVHNKDGLTFIDYLNQNTHLSRDEKNIITSKWI